MSKPCSIRQAANRWGPPLLIVLALAACISREGFWIDEITTAWIASRPSFADVVAAMRQSGSELQMPGYMAWIVSWSRLLGAGEGTLRAANIPWAAIGAAAVWRMLRRSGARAWTLAFLLHPMLAFQMNEARPYLMTFGTAALALDGLDAFATSGSRASAWQVACGTVVCGAASMLNLFLVPALAVYAWLRLDRQRPPARVWTGPALAALFALTVLCAYYAWTLHAGHGGRRSGFGAVNAAAALYEWAGFRGLGPPWYVLREGHPVLAFAPHLPALVAGMAAWALSAAVLVSGPFSPARRAVALSGAAGAFLLAVSAMVARATLWGRHAMFIGPMVVVFFGLSFTSAGFASRRRLPAVAAAAALIGALVTSSFLLRFSPAHGKDPFREAVQVVETERVLSPAAPVAWVAYHQAIPLYAPDAPQLVAAAGWDSARIAEWSARHPEYFVLLHRPDVCDPSGAWRAVLASARVTVLWTLRGMTLYLVRHES